jgi:hypothetical protein
MKRNGMNSKTERVCDATRKIKQKKSLSSKKGFPSWGEHGRRGRMQEKKLGGMIRQGSEGGAGRNREWCTEERENEKKNKKKCCLFRIRSLQFILATGEKSTTTAKMLGRSNHTELDG